MSKDKKTSDEVIFKKNDSIGASDAIDDNFLEECFVNTGALDCLRDTSDKKSIVLGRTGAGKSALLLTLKKYEKNSIFVEPEDLSLSYLTNSTILKYLDELGVNLDIFYKVLWKHVFAVELIRMRFNIKTKEDAERGFGRIFDLIKRDEKKKKALGYFREWNNNFWENTDVRIRELTNKLEEDIKTKAGFDFKGFVTAGGEKSKNIAEAERIEIVERAQKVINQIQISELNEVMLLLGDDVFNDDQKNYYVLIDRLDENWVEDKLRYKLIRSLIENVRDFSRIKNVKIVVALRDDLLARVTRETRDSGFQEEKIRSFFLNIKWSEEQLLILLLNRINRLFVKRYTKTTLAFSDVFPPSVGDHKTENFLLSRTMLRPRDLIEFFNQIIEFSSEKNKITESVILNAERVYSEQRYRSLGDEWFADYSCLLDFASILKQKAPNFLIKEIDDNEIVNCALAIATSGGTENDLLYKYALQISECSVDVSRFKPKLFQIFYLVGLVGLKLNGFNSYAWSYQGGSNILEAEIIEETRVRISPMFYRVLGVRPNKKE